jgi:putative phosphoribosyl transferase
MLEAYFPNFNGQILRVTVYELHLTRCGTMTTQPTPDPLFRNRSEAGQQLAKRLTIYRDRPEVQVLALPRGGVPVAYEVAQALHAPLDVCLVRKLGVPSHRELAMGAIASGGVRVLNKGIIAQFKISEQTIAEVTEKELQELERRDRAYRGERLLPEIGDRIVILIDDGIATGSTMQAAISTLKPLHPAQIIVAVPVAPAISYAQFSPVVDPFVCLIAPDDFYAIGLWYEDFSQTSDEEVQNLLAQAN